MSSITKMNSTRVLLTYLQTQKQVQPVGKETKQEAL